MVVTDQKKQNKKVTACHKALQGSQAREQIDTGYDSFSVPDLLHGFSIVHESCLLLKPRHGVKNLSFGWKMNKSFVLLPFSAVTASATFLYSISAIAAQPAALIRPLLVSWGILLALEWLAYWMTRNRTWSWVFLLIIVLGFFSRFDFAAAILLSSLAMTVLLWIASRLLGKKLNLYHLAMALNILNLAIILSCGHWWYRNSRAIPPSYYEHLPNQDIACVLNPGFADRPDIYYIIVDGYGRADILKELYGFDNHLFLDQLREHGFVIPGQSRSNYMRTVLSVASSLNMEYIDTLTPGLENTGFWWLMSPWIDHSRVRESLERIGYSSVTISSGWDLTDNHTASIYLASNPVMLNEFEKLWLASTPLGLFQNMFETTLSVPTHTAHRYRQLHEFEALSTAVQIPGPKFVFVHILMPHPPFVFLADGTPVDPPTSFTLQDANDYSGSPSQYRDGYIAQLQFLNNRLNSTIENILVESDQPPVIILQSDHGPGMLTDFSSSANSCLAERFSNLSAFYLPGIDPGAIPQDITPVNLFRIIFNEYFDADLAVLENKNYFSTYPIGIYRVQDVTDQVGKKNHCSFELAD